MLVFHYLSKHINESPSIMSDLITAVLLEAKQKGKLKRIDVILRFLRIKYKLKITGRVLNKRIESLALNS